ncbi:MAG: PHB depolymerase family esterase, partial [Rudaea sp.]
AIDLSNERFVVYVPSPAPDSRYGLLVFVPPWNDARIPAQWLAVLDKHALIFVTAAKSGNDANVLDRREPLALLAAQNITDRYAIDPARVFVSGFSGGSRVALRLALAYPDVFRGALLEAGSDPIGTAQIPLPRADLFSRFQENSRIVYLTGRDDREHLDQDAASIRSLRTWCAAGSETQTVPFTAHDVVDATAFDKALTALTSPPSRVGVDQLGACRKKIDDQIASKSLEIETALSNGRLADARAALIDLDTKFGGLASRPLLELQQKIDAARP